MAEPTQYLFTHQELVQALMKQQNIHEGTWHLSIEFVFGATVGGPTPDKLMPTALAGVHRVGLERNDGAKGGLAFDAAQLNPAQGNAPKKKIVVSGKAKTRS